jgi:hypothetical protein
MNNLSLEEVFKNILRRSPNQKEIELYNNMPQEQLIKLLSFSKEKYALLFAQAGENIKFQQQYSQKDIEKYFSSNKYNVAICLSGHIRNYRESLSSINKFIVAPLNADVFIHTWDSYGHQNRISKDMIGPSPDENSAITNDFLNFISNVKGLKIENNKDFINETIKEIKDTKFYLYGEKITNDIFGGQAEPQFIISQLYSINQSWKLLEKFSLENNKKYDLVIKMRIDYKLSSGIFIEDIEKINKNTIFIPDLPYSNHGHPICTLCKKDMEHTDGHLEDVCDVFAYSSQEVMKVYMNTFESLKFINKCMVEQNEKYLNDKNYSLTTFKTFQTTNIWKEHNYDINCFYPERILRFHLKDYKLLSSKLNGEVIR